VAAKPKLYDRYGLWPAKLGVRRSKGTNPRAKGTNPRAKADWRAIARAAQAGHEARRAGKPRTNPYPDASPFHGAWFVGWDAARQ
jgi:hypothetical protein